MLEAPGQTPDSAGPATETGGRRTSVQLTPPPDLAANEIVPNPEPLIQWNVRFNTGHPQIDQQHHSLVDLLNQLAADVDADDDSHTQLFGKFKNALSLHFVFEERALRQLGLEEHHLAAHTQHHVESMQLLETLGEQLAADRRKYSASVLAEIAHCLLVDLLDEDRYYFVNKATRSHLAAKPPMAPALHTYGRLVDLLNEHHERLAEARDYYLTLLDDFPAPICRADRDGKFDWFNSTWVSLTGISQTHACQHGWINAFHPEDLGAFMDRWSNSLAQRVPFSVEYRLRDTNHQWRWIDHIAHPFFDADGEFLGYICTLFDITERRQTETSLRISASVFEYATEAIMVTDATGVIEAVNPAFTRRTGYAANEVIGVRANILRSGFHDDDFYIAMWQTVVSTGSWQGEVINRDKSGELFPAWLSINAIRSGKGELVRMVGVLSDIASSRASRERLTHLAHHDALTGLPNRLLFNARAEHSLERCQREQSRLAVLFIDLDRFKPINDELGHKTGDRALCEVARRLRLALRAEDTVARFGGDEFLVLVERADDVNDAQRVAEKLLSVFPVHAAVGERTMAVSASIGISLYPDDGRTVDELIDAADRSMYRYKHEHRRKTNAN